MKNGWTERPYLFYQGKPCSCYMCGNPRKHFGLKTIHEYRAENNMEDQLKELLLQPA